MCLKAFIYAGFSGFTKQHFIIKNGIKSEPALLAIEHFGTNISGSSPDGCTNKYFNAVKHLFKNKSLSNEFDKTRG